MKDKQLPQVKLVDMDSLCFDPDNPRFMQEEPDHTDLNLIWMLDRNYNLSDLMRSIVYNGLLVTEPLIVVPQGKQWMVIDGNRRLAVLKILDDIDTYKKYLPKDIYRYAAHNLMVKQTQVPVMELQADDEALWKTRVSRHMDANWEWPLLNQSAYVTHLVDELGISIARLSKCVSISEDAFDFYILPMRIILALEEDGRWTRWMNASRNLDDVTLFKACKYPNLMNHVGWKNDTRPDNLNLDHAVELMYWLFGNKWTNTPPLIKDADMDLDALDTIVSDKQSLERLRETGSLEEAATEAMRDKLAFQRNLLKVQQSMQSTHLEALNLIIQIMKQIK